MTPPFYHNHIGATDLPLRAQAQKSKDMQGHLDVQSGDVALQVLLGLHLLIQLVL